MIIKKVYDDDYHDYDNDDDNYCGDDDSQQEKIGALQYRYRDTNVCNLRHLT